MGRAASPKGTDKGTDLIADAAGMVGASTVVLLLSGLGVAAQVCMTRAIGFFAHWAPGWEGLGWDPTTAPGRVHRVDPWPMTAADAERTMNGPTIVRPPSDTPSLPIGCADV